MTTPHPGSPVPDWLKRALPSFFALPGRRSLFPDLVFGRLSVRLEAKLLLFNELASATRMGVPLDVALDLAARSEGRRAARTMASRLREKVHRGHSLSEAMKACAPDYDALEIAAVHQGEVTGDVPGALKRLAEVHSIRHGTSETLWYSSYYQAVALALAAIAVWSTSRLLPKFNDIYRCVPGVSGERGRELPPVTATFMELMKSLNGEGIFLLLVLWFLLRKLMGGRAALTILGVGLGSLYGMLVYASDHGDFLRRLLVALVVEGVVLIVFLGRLLRLGERVVNAIERTAAWIGARIPFLGSSSRALFEATWLGGLAAALRAGLPEVEALRLAGAQLGRRFAARSDAAADAVARGVPLGRACLESGVVQRALATRLQAREASSLLPNAIQLLAEDHLEVARESCRRSRRIHVALGIIVVGLLAFYFALAMYSALFGITMLTVGSIDSYVS